MPSACLLVLYCIITLRGDGLSQFTLKVCGNHFHLSRNFNWTLSILLVFFGPVFIVLAFGSTIFCLFVSFKLWGETSVFPYILSIFFRLNGDTTKLGPWLAPKKIPLLLRRPCPCIRQSLVRPLLIVPMYSSIPFAFQPQFQIFK